MTTPAPPPQQPVPPQPPSGLDDPALAVAVASVLAGVGGPAITVAATIAALKVRFMLTNAAVQALGAVLSQVMASPPPVTGIIGVASAQTSRMNMARRAQYVIAAAKRVMGAARDARAKGEPVGAAIRAHLARERRFYEQHQAAMWNRAAAAGKTDMAALEHGNLLGWNTIIDGRESLECRSADGKNYMASRIPNIGFPGAVHPFVDAFQGRRIRVRKCSKADTLPDMTSGVPENNSAQWTPRSTCKYGHRYPDTQTEHGKHRVCEVCRSQQPPRSCTVEGCKNKHRANGHCNKHLMRLREHGTTDDPADPPSEAERFWVKVDKDGPVPERRPELGPCWIWIGGAWVAGFRAKSGASIAPRTWAWNDMNGPAPDDRPRVLSACGTDRCVNPGHSFTGTYDDLGALTVAGRDECVRGHLFSVYGIIRHGSRFCAECRRIRAREWRLDNPEANAKRHRSWHLRQLGGSDPSYPAILLGDPCSYCGAPAEHIDHIVPLSRGGSGDWDNLTAACAACNMSKGAQSLLTFMLRRATGEVSAA